MVSGRRDRRALPLIAFALLLLASPALAEEAPPAAPPDPLQGRWFLHESFGFNVFTYTGAYEKIAASTVTPKEKAIIFEQVGVGYWVHPNVRLQVTFMYGETLTGLKPTQSSFTLGAVIACVMYTNGGFFAGGGPMLAPRAFGIDDANGGLFTAAGYAFKLAQHWALAPAVQVPVMFADRISVAITPALILSQRY